jgi:hypothetical protein
MHSLKALGRYGTVGLELIISMALGYYGGRWLDRRWDAGGWLTGTGAFLGVVVGFYSIWKASQTMERDVERAEKAARGEDPWAK